MDLLFATHNLHKVKEAKEILKDLDIHLISLDDLNDIDEVEEDGKTFQENAYKKADYFYQKYHMDVFADDSGLVIPALNNEPGVRSARYASIHGDYLKNNLLVLEKMKSITERQAYFITNICYINRYNQVSYFVGRLDGEITDSLRGSDGFGYDPLFLIPKYNKTLSEMGILTKNSLSHRFLALSELTNHLKKEANKMENSVVENVKKILNCDNVEIVERLLGGMSNYTYVVKADNNLYTYRIPGEYAEYFVDREIEKENIKTFEKLDITNQTLYLNTIDGTKLAKYIDGTPLSTLPSYPYELVSNLLKKIHQSNLKVKNDYQPFLRLKNYENYIIDLGYVHPLEYNELRDEFLKFKTYLESQKKVLTHGDSQPSNFVLNNNTLKVVDFEFSANNDPIYDIACFANKKFEEGFQLLHVYFGNPSKDEILRFYLWRCFQALQWYNVAIFKDLKGLSISLKIDFNKVAKHYLELVKFYLDKANQI